jgi:hypothetical protein
MQGTATLPAHDTIENDYKGEKKSMFLFTIRPTPLLD